MPLEYKHLGASRRGKVFVPFVNNGLIWCPLALRGLCTLGVQGSLMPPACRGFCALGE